MQRTDDYQGHPDLAYAHLSNEYFPLNISIPILFKDMKPFPLSLLEQNIEKATAKFLREYYDSEGLCIESFMHFPFPSSVPNLSIHDGSVWGG